MIGKVGTDIEENKCSWLIVQALPRMNEEQKEILKVEINVILLVIFLVGKVTIILSFSFLSL